MAGQKQSRGGTPASSRGRGNQNPGQAARSGAAARSGTVTAQSGPGARNNAGHGPLRRAGQGKWPG